MKKYFLIISALFLFTAAAYSQVNFGIKAGYNSSLNFDNISSVKSGEYTLNNVQSELNNGFHAGAFMRLGIKKFYLQPELLYNMQKKDYQYTVQDAQNQNVDINNYVTFSTIDIPVLLGYKIVDFGIVNIRAFAGPKLRLNAGSQISFENVSDGSVDTDQLKGELKNAQLGLEAGAGVDIMKLTVDFRFNAINDLYQANWETKPDLNSNFVISLGWKF